MITENGQGKQIHYDEFRTHSRGTMGQKIYTFRDKTGYIVGALSVDDSDDLVCITTQGQSIRVPVETISIQKAYASGVCITKLKKEDIIVAVAKTEAEKAISEASSDVTEDNEDLVIVPDSEEASDSEE